MDAGRNSSGLVPTFFLYFSIVTLIFCSFLYVSLTADIYIYYFFFLSFLSTLNLLLLNTFMALTRLLTFKIMTNPQESIIINLIKKNITFKDSAYNI